MADQVQFLYGGFRRLGPFLLDPDSVFATREQMLTYLATSPMVVPGMQLTVWNDPLPENNGSYTIKEIDSSDKKENIRGNFAITESPKAIAVAESEKLKEEVIKPIKEFIGMPIDNSSEPNENNGNNILTRINKIESILELNDEDNERDKINDLRDELDKLSDDLKTLSDNVGNEELAKVFVTIDNFNENNQQISNEITNTVNTAKEELRKDIKILQDYIDLLDDGKIDEIFKDVIKDVNYIRNNINSLLQNFQANFEQMLVNSFNNSYNDPSTGMFKNLVLEVLERDGITGEDGNIRKNSQAISEIQEIQKGHTTSISTITSRVDDLEESIDTKLNTEEFESFKEINTNLITELTANTKKTVSFKFGENSEITSLKLPQGCTITEIRVLIDRASNIEDLTGSIILDSGEIFIGGTNEGELYFDITGAEYIIEKTVKTTTIEPVMTIWCNNNEPTNFGGAIGRVFVTYY